MAGYQPVVHITYVAFGLVHTYQNSLAAPDPTTLKKKGSGETQYNKTQRHRNVSGTNQIAPF